MAFNSGWSLFPQQVTYFCSFSGHLTRCKLLHAKINKTLSRDIDGLVFQRTLGMQEHTQLKQHDNAVASVDV